MAKLAKIYTYTVCVLGWVYMSMYLNHKYDITDISVILTFKHVLFHAGEP